METPLPEPREETAAASLDGQLYVLAGFDAAGRDTDSVFVYRGGWSRGPRLPVALDHPAAAVVSGRLFVAGGFNGGQATSKTYVLAGDHWESAASLRHARGALALVSTGGRLYAIGGNTSSGNVGIAEAYDPGSNSWNDLPPMPVPRNHVAGFPYRSMACVAGGRAPNTARVDCFDPATQTWKSLPDLPRPTSGAGAAVVGDQVIVAGGEELGGTNYTSANIINQLARFDGQTWRSESMLVPRHGLHLGVIADRVWACGGGTAPGLHAVTTCTSIS